MWNRTPDSFGPLCYTCWTGEFHGIEVEHTMRVTNRAFTPPHGAYLNDSPHPPHHPWEAYGGYKAYVAFHEQWNTLTQAAMAPSIAIPPHL